MKVLYITHCRCMFGANKCLLNMMLDMRARKGVEPYVVLPIENDGEFAEILEQYEIPYFVVPFKRWVESENCNLKLLRYWHKECGNKSVYMNAYEQLKTMGFELIHTNSSNVQFGAWLARQLRIPHIWHVREFNEEDYQISIIYPQKIIRESFESSFSVIAISEAIQEKYQTKYCPSANIHLIYDGIEGAWGKVRTKEITGDAIVEFVCTGVLSENKGQYLIIDACDFLQRRGVGGFHVSFIGDGDDEYVDSLKEKVKAYSLEKKISFMGRIEDIKPILSKGNVGITPSSKEAFGRVTVEYMLLGLPVIGSNTGGTKEIVVDNETGLLFEAGQVETLADKMLHYLKNKELIKEHGEKAYDRALHNYTLKANTDQIYELYREAIK